MDSRNTAVRVTLLLLQISSRRDQNFPNNPIKNRLPIYGNCVPFKLLL